MRIPNKFNGYSADNRRLYNFGGGGGGGNNTTTSTGTTYQTNIPEYAKPYVEQMLGATQRQLFTGTNDAQGNFTPTGFNNFTPYGATYAKDPSGAPLKDPYGNIMYTNTAQQQAKAAVAPQSAGQQMATNTINQYVAPSQTSGASQIAGNVAGRSVSSGYYSPLQAERFLLGRPDQVYANQVRTDSFTAPNVSQAYMSPYMQNVVNTQQREAARQSQLLRNQNQAQATSQGAYGGSRQGIVEAERQRNLMQQQSDIQGQGLQQAFGAGQQQFNAEQAAYLQAQQANQQAGLTAQQANQSTNLQTGIQNLQSQQNAQAAQEASRQFGANLGLQGYGQSLQAAQTLGQLGQQQYQQDMGTIQAMSGMGAAEQAQTQNIINQAMQNYSTQQQYPLMQLGVMSNMLRGLPMQASTTQNYQAQPSMLSQAAGAVGTGLGLVQQYNKAFPNKEGGVIKMASGGITSGANQYELNAMYKKFSDAQLGKALDDPEAQREKQRRDALRGAMAAGGIVAFKKGKEVDEERTLTKEEEEKILRAIGVPETPKEAEPSSAERIKSIRQSYVGGQPKEEAMVMPIDKEGIVAAARKNVSPVPDASRTTPPPSAGISAANSPMLGNVNQLYSDVEAANLEAGRDMQGNKIGAEADPADVAIEEHIANLKKQQSPLQEVMNKSKADLVKSYQKEREDINLPDPANRERQLLEDRKTRGEESEKETARNNLIRFLTKWGTIPGSTMRGLIGAGSDLIDKMDVDEKHRQKFLNEMDDIESKINSSEYARRLGDEDRARKEKDEAGKLYYKLASDITEIRLKEALKDKDVRKAIEVEKYKIKREEAKGPKGQEYMVGVYSRALTAGNPTKYPPGPSTDGIAAQMYMRDQPGVQSTAMTLSSREASAGADVTRATTAVTEAATKAKKDARDAVIALDKAVRNKTMTDETISRDIDAANRRDKTGKAAKDIIDRVRKELAPEYGVPLSAPAPAKPAEPKKDDKKGGGWGELKVK